jgi:Amt family ammonium transporter
MTGTDTGNTAWMLICTSLAMLTVVGISLFQGGMVRRKNVLATIMYSLAALCVVSFLWMLLGYSLAFGPDKGGMIGGFEWIGLTGVERNPASSAPAVPHLVRLLFHGMLAAIAPALISGALAERTKFSAFLLLVPLWVTFVYFPLAHWVWGGGWIGNYLSAMDFGGGLVIFVSAGVAGLVAALLVGPRRGFGVDPLPPHDRLLAVLGAALLWCGWLGLAAGSAYSAGGLAAHVMVVTVLSAGAAALCWYLVERFYKGKASVLGTVTGSVAGLVAITGAAGFVGIWASLVIGVVASLACYVAVDLIPRLGVDDACDVFAIFGVGGIWGVLATGLFASARINPAGQDGVFAGNPPLLGIQAIALSFVLGYVCVYTWIILKIVDFTVGLRVAEEDEVEGLDQTQHGEKGYAL